MKRVIFLIATAAVFIGAQCLLAGPEKLEAKDYKSAPSPVVVQPCNWTGFYVGAHGGYAWGEHSFLELNESDPAYDFEGQGFFGGGQVGFNLQLGSFFVLGIEDEFAAGGIDDSDVLETGEASAGTIENDWTGTTAVRIGVTFCKNRLLAYAKGGVAFAHFDYHTDDGNGETFNADHTRISPLAGFGLEYALTCHWSIKAEYKHLFLEDEDVTGVENDNGSLNDRTFRVDGDQDLVQAGVNFRF
jgi:outer membrane immunogenic protein